MRTLLATLSLLYGATALAADRPGLIELWTRAPGQHVGDKAPARQRVMKIDLDRLKLQEGERSDVQYPGLRRAYRFVPIEELLKKYAPAPESDVALLHFSNGMTIPISFRDRKLMDRLQPAVARALLLDGKWTSAFPLITKQDKTFADARPLEFAGNKLVVAEPWHPRLPARATGSFSPWTHADSLAGIELIDESAYLAQFDVDPAAHAGFDLFRQVCSFCHGARKVGAQFGWDFVEPLPIYEYRKRDSNLYYHIRYRPSNAPARGLMMPALAFLTQDDAGALLTWLRAVATRPLRGYAPGAKK